MKDNICKIVFLRLVLTVVCVFILPALAMAGTECKAGAPTHITISPATVDVEYDYSKTLSDIQRTKTDTVDPYGVHSSSITQGFMEGQISMRRQIDLDFSLVDGGRNVCLWYKTIDVSIDISPKIVIAKEVKRDKCMYEAVLEHEKKHVYVDRKLVNEYSQIIGQDLYKKFKGEGFAIGPVSKKDAQAYADKMVKLVMDFTQKYYNTMSEERARRQGDVDSLEEYERVKAQCPNFYRNRSILFKNALKTKQKYRKDD